MSDPDGLSDQMPSIDEVDEWLMGVDLSDEEAVASLDFDLHTIWQYGVNYMADAEDLRAALKALVEAKTKKREAAQPTAP